MKKLLQINICSNVLSTGKICEDIAKVAQSTGWETYIAYNSNGRPSVSQEIRIGSKVNKYRHFIQNKLFDNEGLNSRKETLYLLDCIEKIRPDVVHLHNIHDHWLNYPMLFQYIAKHDLPVVWTQHDCWSFTGGCMYFDLSKCEKWKNGCSDCPERRGLLVRNRSERNFRLKKELLDSIPSVTFVPVSDWLNDLMKQSVQKNRPIVTIHNGIDISKFKPMPSDSRKKFNILGVAAVWDARKGLQDFIRLRCMLPSEFGITLVGLTSKQIQSLPRGIEGICRTSSVEELVKLYSDADVFVNPTYSDNFPTTNLEALACGTSVITYRTGGSPEAVDEQTGIVVEQGDIEGIVKAVLQMKRYPYSLASCRKRAEDYFDKDKCFDMYLTIYDNALKGIIPCVSAAGCRGGGKMQIFN